SAIAMGNVASGSEPARTAKAAVSQEPTRRAAPLVGTCVRARATPRRGAGRVVARHQRAGDVAGTGGSRRRLVPRPLEDRGVLQGPQDRLRLAGTGARDARRAPESPWAFPFHRLQP